MPASESSADQTFTFGADVEFRVDRSRRRVSGMVLPWGKVAYSGGYRWRFARSSIELPADIGRIKLLKDHDPHNAVGKALGFDDRDDGLYAEFSVKRGPDGDQVLSEAEDGVLDGFSVGPAFESGGWERDDADPDVRLVRRARLVETSIVAIPAFDDARVASVVASQKGTPPMPEEKPGDKPDTGAKPTILRSQDSGMERFQHELDERMTLLADKMTEANTAAVESVSKAVAEAFTAAFTRLEDTGAAGADVAAARIKVIREEPVYRFDGDVKQHSLVRDAWHAHANGDYDARQRLHKFAEQQQDLVKFATVTTSTASQVIPPGYRPDLYVTQLMQDRPIVSLASRGTLSDATPFTIPRFVSATGATADHVQGTNPTDGTLSLDTVTVTPGAISGKFILTREVIDAANPAIDAIAMAAMRESWNRQTEQKAYAELNIDANVGAFENHGVAAGTGTQAVTSLRNRLALYPFSRFASPTGAVIGQLITGRLATANDTTNRPLLPSVGAQNAAGLGNAVTGGWFVDGLAHIPAWAMTQAVGDELALIVNRNDFWVWESPLLTFRFEEKSGPALIELALFGYYATKVIRPAGIASLRATA